MGMLNHDEIEAGVVLLAQRAKSLFSTDDSTVWASRLESLCSADAVSWWLDFDIGSEALIDRHSLDRIISLPSRRARGIFFTPTELATNLATRVPDKTTRLLDPACGDGALLAAAAHREIDLVGVEREPLFVVASALRLLHHRDPRPGDFIHWGDGLDEAFWDVDAVIANPPYVPEKGNRELLAATKQKHGDLSVAFRGKMDLFYFFLARAAHADCRSIFLTSDYWLTADGAQGVRDLIRAVGVATLERIGAGRFPDAPGHHSLISEFGAYDGPTTVIEPDGGHRVWSPSPGVWSPFAKIARERGPLLADLLCDFQGIVSGADRVTRRNGKKTEAEIGSPIFMREEPTVGLPWRPLLRASMFRSGDVIVGERSDAYLLYLDGSESSEVRELAELYLAPFRAILQDRREVTTGNMHWTRLHWPRKLENFLRPKLVVPRRATSCCFALDLGGHVVSSDCTILNAPGECPDPIRHLVNLMVVHNRPQTEAHLRAFGKTKGDVIEFYSSPLRAIPLPVTVENGVAELTVETDKERARGILQTIDARLPRAVLLDDETNGEVVLSR